MKLTLFIIGLLGLLVGFSSGYILGADTINTKSSEHSENDHSHGVDEHSHDTLYEVPAENAPTVSFTVVEDEKSGWNIELTTTNFEFAPSNVNGANVTGEGHAHLYIDGGKVARLYGPNFHYPENFDGSRDFVIELNSNDHSVYAVNGQAIEATQTVTHEPHGSDHSE